MKKDSVKKLDRLADAELDIMRVLWQADGCLKASEIVKCLSETRSWKTQTAHVLLKRLEDKGFVTADKSAYVHTYVYAVGEGDYFASESDSLFKRIGGSFKTLVASMIDTDDITAEELSELSEILEKKRAELENKGK